MTGCIELGHCCSTRTPLTGNLCSRAVSGFGRDLDQICGLFLTWGPLFPVIIDVTFVSWSEGFLWPILLPPSALCTYPHPHDTYVSNSISYAAQRTQRKNMLPYLTLLTPYKVGGNTSILWSRRLRIREVYRRPVIQAQICLTREKKIRKQHFLFKLSVHGKVLLVLSLSEMKTKKTEHQYNCSFAPLGICLGNGELYVELQSLRLSRRSCCQHEHHTSLHGAIWWHLQTPSQNSAFKCRKWNVSGCKGNQFH